MLLSLTGLASIGAAGYLVFWLWFLNPHIGHLVAFLIPVAGVVFLIWSAVRCRECLVALRPLMLPLLLVGTASTMALTAGYAWGGTRKPLSTPWTRFSHGLPPDNEAPFVLAEGVRVHKIPKPMIGDWRSSDRPPLQTGLALSHYPFMFPPRALEYEILSVQLQSLWAFALWLFVAGCGLSSRLTALILAVCLFSGFVLVNTFYVWPKMLAAAFLIAFLALVFTAAGLRLMATYRGIALLTGALLALSILSHGGTVFAVFGLIPAVFSLGKPLPWKRFALAAAFAAVLYAPWLLYQKLFDPPGDRLLTYHLAGIEHVDSRPALQIIKAQYAHHTAAEILANKISNFSILFGSTFEYFRDIAVLFSNLAHDDPGRRERAEKAAHDLRAMEFFSIGTNFGLLLLGLPALFIGVFRWRKPEWQTAARLWFLVGATLVCWCLLMFGPQSAVIHQGAYVVPLFGYAASIAACWVLSRAFAVTVAIWHIAFTVVLYVVVMPPPALEPPDVPAPHYATITLALLSCAAALALLVRLSQNRDDV